MRLLIVPARSGSQRIKDKNIHNFYGKPMLVHSLEIAKKSKIFDFIHLSTDSEKYANIAEKFGFKVNFLRKKNLSLNKTPILEVIKNDCIKFSKLNYKFKEVCMLTATSPLIRPNDLINMRKIYVKNKKKYPVLTVAEFPGNIERALHLKNNLLKYINKNHILKNSQIFSKKYYDTGNAFYYNFEELVNFKNSGFNKLLPYILPNYRSVDINEFADLELCKKLYKVI